MPVELVPPIRYNYCSLHRCTECFFVISGATRCFLATWAFYAMDGHQRQRIGLWNALPRSDMIGAPHASSGFPLSVCIDLYWVAKLILPRRLSCIIVPRTLELEPHLSQTLVATYTIKRSVAPRRNPCLPLHQKVEKGVAAGGLASSLTKITLSILLACYFHQLELHTERPFPNQTNTMGRIEHLTSGISKIGHRATRTLLPLQTSSRHI